MFNKNNQNTNTNERRSSLFKLIGSAMVLGSMAFTAINAIQDQSHEVKNNYIRFKNANPRKK